MINVLNEDYKNGKRYLRQAESSAIRFQIIAQAFTPKLLKGWQLRMYTLGCRFCIPKINCRSVCPRSARELLSQFSHPFERGAVRFLFWWLFLHLWLRPSNVGSTCVEPFALFSGSCPKSATRFYPNGSR